MVEKLQIPFGETEMGKDINEIIKENKTKEGLKDLYADYKVVRDQGLDIYNRRAQEILEEAEEDLRENPEIDKEVLVADMKRKFLELKLIKE